MTTESSTGQIRVWDPLIRVFHWTLVISFLVAYLSGDELEQVHIYAGYVITGLLVFRLVWGFIGTRHARFSDFIYSRQEITDYLKSLVSGRPKRYLGHNPAGAVMVFLLLVSLTFTVATGLVMDAGTETPAVQQTTTTESWFAWAEGDDDDHDEEHGEGGEEFLEEVHEFFANFTLFLVFLHVAGVGVSSLLHRENLVRAMITGRKPADPDA